MIIMISGLLVVLVSLLFLLISFKKLMDYESSSTYECGFNLISGVRVMFSYRFFLISILFLIFDVEIALMLPIPWISVNSLSVFIFFFFFFILIGGLIYEYYCGSLNWL